MSALFLLVLAGSAGCRTAPPAPPPQPSIPVRPPASTAPRDGWQSIWFWGFDQVVRTVGLRPLRDDTLAAGQREVRAWIGGGLGYPRQMYRLRMEEGRVRGELFHYWRMDRDPKEADGTRYETLIRRMMRGPCGPIVTGELMEVCGGLFTAEPDWPALLAQAEAAGLWTLPDEGSLPTQRILLDGWSLVVELRDGSAYRVYKYGSPSADVSPEHGRALEVATAFSRANAASRPSEVVRRYRGLARTGPSLHEFRPCASPETWELTGRLRGLDHDWTVAPRADTATAGVRQHYVVVDAELAPDWLARRWKSEHLRVLQVRDVIESRAWSPDACAGAPPPEIVP